MAAAPPPKPWERNRGVSASSPAGVSSLTSSTSNNPIDNSTTVNQNTLAAPAANTASLTRPVPSRPWERNGLTSTSYTQPYGNSTYGGTSGLQGNYGTSSYMNQYGGMGSTYGGMGSTYGGMGSTYGGIGSTYGGGVGMNGFGSYGGRPMYGGYGAGSSMYGSPYNSFGSSYSSPMYGGMGGVGNSLGPPGMFDPNNPPAQPPSAWQHFLMAMNGALQFFGKICFLVDENTHAFHFFINALLQLLDRAGSLYGELARFILRLLRRKKTRGLKELEHTADGAPLALKQPAYEASQALVPRSSWTPAAGHPNGPNWDGIWQN